MAETMPPCRYFTSGTCQKGNSCKFPHTGDAPADSFLPKAETACRFYFKGQCRNSAEACSFSHDANIFEKQTGKSAPWQFTSMTPSKTTIIPTVTSSSSSSSSPSAAVPPPSPPVLHPLGDLPCEISTPKALLRSSALNRYSYHVIPPSPAPGQSSSSTPGQSAPSTWPALELFRLAACERLFRSFQDWQQSSGVRVAAGAFELAWLGEHLDEALEEYRKQGLLSTDRKNPVRPFLEPLLPACGLSPRANQRLKEALVMAGASEEAAEEAVAELSQQAEQARGQLLAVAGRFDARSDIGQVTVEQVNEHFYRLTLPPGRSSSRQPRPLKVSAAHLDKLRRLWAAQQQRTGSALMGVCDDDVYCALARAMAMAGGGGLTSSLHGAVPAFLFKALQKAFSEPFLECFANPINAHHSRFFSASLDVDFKFGSLGSFFHASPSSGCFFAHPPPSPLCVPRVLTHILSWFPSAEFSKSNSLSVLLLLSLPSSLSEQQRLTLLESTDAVVVSVHSLPQLQHAFLDGQQHRKLPHQSLRRAHPHASLLVFFQTSLAAQHHPVTSTLFHSLEVALQLPLERPVPSRKHSSTSTAFFPTASSSSPSTSSLNATVLNDSRPNKRIRFD